MLGKRAIASGAIRSGVVQSIDRLEASRAPLSSRWATPSRATVHFAKKGPRGSAREPWKNVPGFVVAGCLRVLGTETRRRPVWVGSVRLRLPPSRPWRSDQRRAGNGLKYDHRRETTSTAGCLRRPAPRIHRPAARGCEGANAMVVPRPEKPLEPV